MLVVMAHVPMPGTTELFGAVGVGAFFVLSGFLMGYLYGQTPWSSATVGRYCIVRFARIAPIYWLVVSVCILLSYTSPRPDFPIEILGAQQIARHYLFAGSAGVLWSVSPEVQFYGFFVLMWGAIAVRAQKPFALAALAVLCAALLLTHNAWPGMALPHKLHFFLAGVVAGLMPRPSWRDAADAAVLPWLQGAALLLLAAPLWMFPSKEDFYAENLMGGIYAVAIYLLSFPSTWTRAVLASRALRKVGQASFSIYLMHVLVIYYGAQLLRLRSDAFEALWLLLGLLAVLLPMVVSHYVEMPLQRGTRRLLERVFGFGGNVAQAVRVRKAA
ncbi:MAG: acyltransferase [Rhodoferax sp.]|nr:acyltransferase [Rhodoferax sp.]